MEIRAKESPGFKMSLAMEAKEEDEVLMRCALMRLAAIMLITSLHLLCDACCMKCVIESVVSCGEQNCAKFL